jgi:predicted branched-subunit amino acid permease
MVNLLVAVLLSGLAVTFTIEFISLFVGLLISKERLYSVLSLPLSFGALYCFYPIETNFAVSVPAISFIVLFINKYINKPIVLPSRR